MLATPSTAEGDVEWVSFFFGTPRRALATIASLAALGLVHHCAPGAVGRLLVGGIEEFWPLICYVLFLALVVMVVRSMFGSRR